MKKCISIVILIFIANISLSQTNNMEIYKYIYHIKLDNYPTSCFIETINSKLIDSNLNRKITFTCKQIDGEIDNFLYLTIIQNRDTIRLKSDSKGLVDCYLKSDYFDLIVNSVTSEETKFKISVEGNEIINNIIIYSGIDYSLINPIVYSKRQLNPCELFLIKEDIRNNTKKSKLLRNNTCLLLFEM